MTTMSNGFSTVAYMGTPSLDWDLITARNARTRHGHSQLTAMYRLSLKTRIYCAFRL